MALNVHTRKGTSVRDPYKTKERFDKWDRTLPDANPQDQQIILSYIADMEDGRNVGGGKKERSPIRLMTIKSRMCTLSRIIKTEYNKTLLTITDEELHKLFKNMRTGKITKKPKIEQKHGEPYRAVADYVKAFKAFWHWYQRQQRRQGKDIPDITIDLDAGREKPKFNYLTYEQIKLLADNAKYEYRMLIWFMYDSGMRPTEMENITINDLTLNNDGIYECNIRDETSKTFGRKIKLLLCSSLLKEYIKRFNLQNKDFLWNNEKTGANHNKTYIYIKRLGERVLKLKDLSLYDIRHCSACYWLPRYKNESALKYRFGWEKSEMITYYTEFLGMKDTITQEDLIDSEDKSKLQQELDQTKKQMALLQEQMRQQQDALIEALNLLKGENSETLLEALKKKKKQ